MDEYVAAQKLTWFWIWDLSAALSNPKHLSPRAQRQRSRGVSLLLAGVLKGFYLVCHFAGIYHGYTPAPKASRWEKAPVLRSIWQGVSGTRGRRISLPFLPCLVQRRQYGQTRRGAEIHLIRDLRYQLAANLGLNSYHLEESTLFTGEN